MFACVIRARADQRTGRHSPSLSTPLVGAGTLLLFDEFAGEDPAEARAFSESCRATGVRAVLLALFGRGPSGKGARTDRRALFQIVTDEPIRPAPPLAPTELRRRLLSKT